MFKHGKITHEYGLSYGAIPYYTLKQMQQKCSKIIQKKA